MTQSQDLMALIADLLAPAPTKTPKAQAPKAQTPKTPASPTQELPPHRNPQWIPEVEIFEVVHQECTTCGSTVEFIRNRLVRFRNPLSRQLKTAVETATARSDIPARADHVWEKTNVCPRCIEMAARIDEFFERPPAQQLELF